MNFQIDGCSKTHLSTNSRVDAEAQPHNLHANLCQAPQFISIVSTFAPIACMNGNGLKRRSFNASPLASVLSRLLVGERYLTNPDALPIRA
jgi:hypothetical protein